MEPVEISSRDGASRRPVVRARMCWLACVSTSRAGACEGKLSQSGARMQSARRRRATITAGMQAPRHVNAAQKKARASTALNGVRRAEREPAEGVGAGSERTPSGWRTCRHAEVDLHTKEEALSCSLLDGWSCLTAIPGKSGQNP